MPPPSKSREARQHLVQARRLGQQARTALRRAQGPGDGQLAAPRLAADLDPLKLLEEMRAVQAYLAALADGERLSAARGPSVHAGERNDPSHGSLFASIVRPRHLNMRWGPVAFPFTQALILAGREASP